jgi:hypothetical protein
MLTDGRRTKSDDNSSPGLAEKRDFSLKNFHFSQKSRGKICCHVKHFLNIPDIFFYSCFNNKNNKKGIFI